MKLMVIDGCLAGLRGGRPAGMNVKMGLEWSRWNSVRLMRNFYRAFCFMVRRICHLLGAVVAFVSLAACGKASDRPANEILRGSVCVDRFLVDIPGVVQVGDGYVGYKRGITIDGISDYGVSGVCWGGLSFFESKPSDGFGVKKVLDESRGALDFIGGARSWLNNGMIDEIGYAQRRLKSKDSAVVEAAKKHLLDIREEEGRVRRSIKVSGEVKTKDADSFAIRYGNDFLVGYLSPIDKRIRVIQGVLSDDAPDNAQAAAMMYEQLRSVYRELPPGEVPQGHGYCTGHGFIKESADQVQWRTRFHLPYRSLNHPNLIITFEIQGRDKQAAPTGDIRQADNPNSITLQDIRDMKGWGALGMLAGMAEIKRTHGPEYLDIAGQKGRIIGREYKPDSGAGAAYEFEAEVLGVPGQIDKPAMRITMAAALPDPDPLPAGEVARRPALKGTKPPPFKEGLDYFRKVLLSMRPRPVVDEAATARSAANAP